MSKSAPSDQSRINLLDSKDVSINISINLVLLYLQFFFLFIYFILFFFEKRIISKQVKSVVICNVNMQHFIKILIG